ncbi:phage portal protein [Lactobacillus acidophilus]|uniref:phage portal protein n=1 Tax=Lactobacillus acidophilus TaxID=1579 RepID=UPI00096AC112|nr:phage portal protein [Lactobacillus acidophilus]ASN46464.1 phage portal protein [Lactobacillus acidophilus]AVW86383.1 portal protein [Lactobacillus acidophilus]AZN77125.1 phage portal protein [Lactobacillus acidophilus]KAB1965330.1 phage portal protein [Lactobacillus acidophilus]MBO8211994.1 phage portal protein [Lactobacillus acidophilus]
MTANGDLYYTYTQNYDDYQAKNKPKQVILLSDEVLHIAGLGFDGLIGYSPIAMAKNAIGLSMAAEQYGSTFFKNDATPGGVLEHPNVVKDPERLRKSWQAQFSGSNNHSIAVLEEGMTFHQLLTRSINWTYCQAVKYSANSNPAWSSLVEQYHH